MNSSLSSYSDCIPQNIIGIRKFRTIDHGRHFPLAHDADAVAHQLQLRYLRRDHDHCHSLLCQALNDFINLIFRTDINAAGGFVEDQHADIAVNILGNDYLLLITATEISHILEYGGAGDAQYLRAVLGVLQFLLLVDQAQTRQRLQIADGHILVNRRVGKDPLLPPLLRHKRDASG